MAISVDIADRLYDYTDEEKAAEAVAQFQDENGLDDDLVIAIWECENDPRRVQLERSIGRAIDSNGSALRANEHIAVDITLTISGDESA